MHTSPVPFHFMLLKNGSFMLTTLVRHAARNRAYSIMFDNLQGKKTWRGHVNPIQGGGLLGIGFFQLRFEVRYGALRTISVLDAFN